MFENRKGAPKGTPFFYSSESYKGLNKTAKCRIITHYYNIIYKYT